MTENEKLDLLIINMQDMKDEMQDIKEDVRGMKDEIQDIKEDVRGMKDEIQDIKKEVQISKVIRFCGGGALGEVTCQILSDILQREIEVVDSPQNVGAVGAAACIAVGLNLIPSLEHVKPLIPAKKHYYPNPEHKDIYNRNFRVFQNLYKSNKENFAILNS